MSQVSIYFEEVNLIYIWIFYTKIHVGGILMNLDVVNSNSHNDDIQHVYLVCIPKYYCHIYWLPESFLWVYKKACRYMFATQCCNLDLFSGYLLFYYVRSCPLVVLLSCSSFAPDLSYCLHSPVFNPLVIPSAFTRSRLLVLVRSLFHVYFSSLVWITCFPVVCFGFIKIVKIIRQLCLISK